MKAIRTTLPSRKKHRIITSSRMTANPLPVSPSARRGGRSPLRPRSEASRLAALRHSLSRLKLDALFITHLPHIRWLTGFTGSNAVVLVSSRKQWLLTDGRYKTQAPNEVEGFEILTASKSLFALAAEKKLLRPRTRVGIPAGHLTLAVYHNVRRLFSSMRLVDTVNVVEPLVAVKEEFEIVLIRKAVEITDAVFTRILRLIKPGIRELDIAAEISYLHRTAGSDGDAFEPLVASGERGALPHARASERKLRRGDLVTLDFGCRFRGYCSDLTRTVAVGTVSREKKKIYSTVLEAQLLAIERAAEGVHGKTLDRIARNHIRKRGYGRYFNHSLGHGVGLEIHEPLRLSALSKDVLQTRNVATIEPGIYVPNVCGVRLEDDIVIRGKGCEVLNRSTKELLTL
ncbi:MAG: aminopeptidase P family protein [Ignavibacteriales bacterium]|nr:aminopeptidase P family protein [Ignavibacteriales bacterium]